MEVADEMTFAGYDARNAKTQCIAAGGEIGLDLAENHIGDFADGIDRHFMRDRNRLADHLGKYVANSFESQAKRQCAFEARLPHADHARNVAYERDHAFADFIFGRHDLRVECFAHRLDDGSGYILSELLVERKMAVLYGRDFTHRILLNLTLHGQSASCV